MAQTTGSSGGKRGGEGGEETEDFEGVAEGSESQSRRNVGQH